MIKKSDISTLPEKPGVYFFKEGKRVLYIGKAGSLRDRVRSYFSKDISASRGPKIEKMLELVDAVDWQETDSVLEALILESKLIKEQQPEYNTKEKDNKSYNYLVVTDEVFPRIFTVRERELLKKGTLGFKVKYSFGPFPNGKLLREALSIMRKIFPFLDKKSTQKTQTRFYEMLGLAPDTSEKKAKTTYNKTIQNIQLFFQGKKVRVLKNLEHEMKSLAKELRFEEAEVIKKQIFALQHIRDASLVKENENMSQKMRIEAYDVAHTSGKDTVGVMVVVNDGEPDKQEYRKFKIKSDKKGSDTDALREILERRLEHPEWPLPQLIVIDGGTAQKNAAERVLKEAGNHIPIVAVVKDEHHRPREIRGAKKYTTQYEKEILLANYEAHRFAVKYHRSLRKKIN